MRAPQHGRTRDEIVREALEVIKPPAEQRDAVRAQLISCVDAMPKLVVPALRRWTAREPRMKQLRRYLKYLLATRQACLGGAEFLAALDAEIERVQQRCDKRYGKKPRDHVAEVAALYANDLLKPRRRTLTPSGHWITLTMLFYEAATGRAERDHVEKYCRELKHGKIARFPSILKPKPPPAILRLPR